MAFTQQSLQIVCIVLACSILAEGGYYNRRFQQKVDKAREDRRIAEETFGDIDRKILAENSGERNLRRQTAGNRDLDFLDFDELQILSQGFIGRATDFPEPTTDDFRTEAVITSTTTTTEEPTTEIITTTKESDRKFFKTTTPEKETCGQWVDTYPGSCCRGWQLVWRSCYGGSKCDDTCQGEDYYWRHCRCTTWYCKYSCRH